MLADQSYMGIRQKVGRGHPMNGDLILELKETLSKNGVSVSENELALRLEQIGKRFNVDPKEAKNLIVKQYLGSKIRPIPLPEKKNENIIPSSYPIESFEDGMGRYYVISGIASVRYNGKMEDEYDGKAVVLIKPDNSIVVHKESGVLPRNYLKSSNDISLILEGSSIKVSASSGKENLEIIFHKVDLFTQLFKPGWSKTIVDNIPTVSLKRNDGDTNNDFKVLTDDEKKLESKLKELRLKLARESSMSAFIIFENKVLHRLVKLKPQSMDQLYKIKGMGPARIQKYGALILEVIKACSEGVN